MLLLDLTDIFVSHYVGIVHDVSIMRSKGLDSYLFLWKTLDVLLNPNLLFSINNHIALLGLTVIQIS